MKSILLAGALLLATPVFFSACQEDAPEIDYEMKVTVVNDFTKVVEAINNGALKNEQAINQLKQAIDQMNADQKTKMQAIIAAINAVNNTLDTKLAVIEAAIKAQTLSMDSKMELLKGVIEAQSASLELKLGAIKTAMNEQTLALEAKMDLIHDIIGAQTTALELKIAAIEAAVKAQTLSMEAKMDLIHDIIASQTAALELKIGAIEAAIKAQTLSMEAKMDLIHDIITAQTSALELKLAAIETAMKEESIALADKLALVEKAIKDQTTNFDTKMELLTTAVTSMPDYRDKLAAIETAINNVPDYATQLAAIKAVLSNVNSTLTDKLALLESIETAITDNAAKLDAIKAVIDALPDYSTAFTNIKTEIANLLQAVKDGTTSTETALAAIAAKIEEMKAAGGVSGGGTTGGGTGTEKIVPKDFVDLGLPSGLLWAKCNIGAATESETGGYFSWGETAPKTAFGLSKYKFGDNFTKFSKYNVDDKLKQLQPEDDAATVILGPWCHIPTKAEWEELIEKCTWEATKMTMPGITEPVVACWKVTGPNGNHIILPSTGWYGEYDFNFDSSHYYSSTLSYDDMSCYALTWDHSGVTKVGSVSYDHPTITSRNRFFGNVIRAVCSTK